MLPRGDGPGVCHHVMNRGLAHRAAFEDEGDIRFFKSLLARQVRDGRLRVHAFTFLTTHFHLLVESARGELSYAMMRVESEYVRWFNHKRGRDGPLFKSRFTSRWVDFDRYWLALVRYIDHNAVQARLVDDPGAYPHGSAWHYGKPRGPIWLARHRLEQRVLEYGDGKTYRPEDYRRLFGTAPSNGQRWIVDRRIEEGGPHPDQPDPFRDLVGAAPESVRQWLRERAQVADATRIGQPIADPDTVLGLIETRRAVRREWRIPSGAHSNWNAWRLLSVGLLRSACGLRHHEITRWVQVAESTVLRALRGHRLLLETDADYAGTATELLEASLADEGN